MCHRSLLGKARTPRIPRRIAILLPLLQRVAPGRPSALETAKWWTSPTSNRPDALRICQGQPVNISEGLCVCKDSVTTCVSVDFNSFVSSDCKPVLPRKSHGWKFELRDLVRCFRVEFVALPPGPILLLCIASWKPQEALQRRSRSNCGV